MVPLDYAEPDAETIEIALARLRTNSPARRGTLLFNPGGPGATLVWDASYLLTQLSSIFENMDIVLMDNRGMGRSYPMQCIDVGQQPPVADPEDYSIEGQVAAGADYMTRLLESCDERFAERMTFFNTENVARDMEMLRLGLGEAQLHYWGVSYGTMQGALYAAMFPQGVGPWVLDSPVVRFEFGDPDMGDLFVESGREYETQLERFVAYCDASEQCGLSDGTAGGTGGALDQLQATLDDGVSYLDFDLPPYLLASFLETTLRWGDWDTIDLALSEALGGDWYSVLSTLFAEGGENEQDDQNSEVANLVINRTDYGCPANFTLDDAVAMATDVAEQFPRLGRWNGLRAGLCVPWNLARSEPAIIPAQVAAPPIVVMGALYDPATPYANAVALVEQLDNGSRLLTSDTEGHGVGTSSDCALNVLIDVVENGNVEAVPAVCGELTPQGLGAAPAARDAAEQLSRWMLDHDSRLGTPRVRL
jgi:pimeloyl-ACP methyl ester carboxylesterase